MATIYDIGDLPTATVTFRDLAGDLSSPSAITFQLKAPDGTIETADQDDATEDSTGVWSWTPTTEFDQVGRWHYRAAATAPFKTAVETTVLVRTSEFD